MTPPGGQVDPAWERGMARVLHEGRPVGVAFLIPDRLLLTCAHVVADAAGLPHDEVLPDLMPVTVDFPLLPGRPEATAFVHFSVPVGRDGSGDVAALQLGGEPPPGAAPLRIVEAENLAGHRWRAFGFPWFPGRNGGKDAGVWTRGTVEGREGTGWWQLTCDEDAAFPLAGGYSGAPVWDEEYGGAIGIVVAVESDPRRRTGYALTVESLTREWPSLRKRLLADSPYRELLAFTEHDRAVFHGRTHETQQLIELVEQQVPLLPVLGPSGVGKSSLVGAGLLGHLDSDAYVVARLPHGLRLSAEETLAWALASAGGTDGPGPDRHDLRQALARQLTDERGIRAAVEQTLAQHRPGARLLLVADQFETLLADAPGTARRLDAMLGILTARRADGSRPAQAVVVARIDFLRQIEELPHLSAAWETTAVVVQPMTRAQLRDAVTRPLEGHAGVRFADGLVEQLLRDTPPGPAALPMLEYALSRLWERQERGLLTTSAYQETGGVEGVLTREAEKQLWGRADAAEQRALERIFIQLVRPGEHLDAGEPGPDTRRVAARSQFHADDWALIHRLAGTRLVVVTRRPTELDTAELAHQALVENWPRLRHWVDRNREFRQWQEGLRRALRAWQEQGRPRKQALGRRQVTEARKWIRARGAEVPAEEVEFVDASSRIRRRRDLVLLCSALLTALVVLAAGLATLDARSDEAKERALAAARSLTEQSRQLGSEDPALAARLALAAHSVAPTPQTRALLLGRTASPLRATLTGHTSEVESVAVGPDGTTLASSASDGTARLWNLDGHRPPTVLDGYSSQVQTTAFSPDGRTLATSHNGRKVRLWDVRTGKQTGVLDGASGPALFTPDGGTVVTGNDRGRAEFWDVRSRRRTGELRLHPGDENVSVQDLALGPDGTTLAITLYGVGTDADDKSVVQLWDMRTKRRTATLRGHTGQVSSLAFSPDGATLATGASDATIRLWNVRTHRSSDPLTGPRGTVFALAFSPNGRTLASAGEDRTVWMWDFRARTALTVLNGHTGLVSALAFSPDGATLASGSSDASVRLWDMRVGQPRVTIPRPADAEPRKTTTVPAFDQSPDGRTLAVGDDYGGVRLFDARTRSLSGRLTGVGGMVSSVRFSPDGRFVAASSNETPRVHLWDARSHHRLAVLDRHTRPVYAVHFSPDSRTLATSSYIDDTTRLWDVRTHRHMKSLPGGSSWADFAPDGSTLVTGSFASGSVKVWDARSHRLLGAMDAVGKWSASVAFSPDGRTLATSGSRRGIGLWDLRSRRLGTTLRGHTDSVQSVAFTPDGKTLVSSGRDAVARLWDVRTGRRLATLGGHTGIVDSAVVSPDGRTVATTGDDRTVRLWDLATHQQSALLTGHTAGTRSAAFSSDGETLVTNGSDHTVRLWDTRLFADAAALTDRACALAGRSLTEQEWRRYVPEGITYRSTCP